MREDVLDGSEGEHDQRERNGGFIDFVQPKAHRPVR